MLDVSLRASFTGGGFNFDATMSGLTGTAAAVDLTNLEFDPQAVLDLVADLAPPELAGVIEAAQRVAALLGDELGRVSIGGDLLAPFTDLLAPLGQLGALRTGIGGEVGTQVGLDGLGLRLDQGIGLVADGPIGSLVGLAEGAIPGLSVTGRLADLGGAFGGVLALIRLVGGLMAVETVTAKVARQVDLVVGMLDPSVALAMAERLQRLAAQTDLAAAVGATDPADGLATAEVVERVRAFVIAIRDMSHEWSRGLGFGEAALLGLDVAGSRGQLELARLALDETQVVKVAALATTVRGVIDPVLRIQLPDPQAELTATVSAALAVFDELAGIVDGLDVDGLIEAITRGLDAGLAPLRSVAGAVESVSTTLSSGIRAVRDLVTEVDLSPVADGVTTALDPLTRALDAVDEAISAATGALEHAAEDITASLTTVANAVRDASLAVQTALGFVSSRLAEVDFEAVQAAIEGGLGSVADLLASAQLGPYFGAAIDAVDTTADVVDAVPFGLLPSDVQQEIVDAVRPIKEIDFDAIAAGLRGQLGEIVDSLDTDVLEQVDLAYRAVITFLESIDPAAAIARFEAGAFADLKEKIDAVDPEAVLAPLGEQLAGIQSLLGGIDLRAAVLGPLEEVFTTVRARLAELDPALLLAPVEAELDGLRTTVTDQLLLGSWATAITEGRDRLVGLLELLDPAALSATVTAGLMDRLRNDLRPGSSSLGALVARLAEATGIGAEGDAFGVVLGWLGPVNGQAIVEGRLADSDARLGVTVDAVRGLDPQPVVSAAQSTHRALVQSVASLPAGSALRVQLEPLLADNDPAVVLAPLIENRSRYLLRLEADAGALHEMAATGLSQVTAVTDQLRDALAPLTSAIEWARTLLGRFGLGEPDRPWNVVIADLVEAAGPDIVLPPLVGLLERLRDLLVQVVDGTVAPVHETVTAVEDAVASLDLGPILAELSTLHAGVVAVVDQVDPAVLLGATLDDADALVERLETFDPLAPVRTVITALRLTIDTTFESAKPSVVFAPVTRIYAAIVDLASGLDVRSLLEPVLAALEGLAAQLDAGIDETADALGRLQAALPDSVSDPSASVGVSVGISL